MKTFFSIPPSSSNSYLLLIIGFDKYYARMLELEGEELGIRCVRIDSFTGLHSIDSAIEPFESFVAAVNFDILNAIHDSDLLLEFLRLRCLKTAFICTKKAFGGAFSFISENSDKMRVFRKPFPITELLTFIFTDSTVLTSTQVKDNFDTLQIKLSDNPHSASYNGNIIYFTPKEFKTLVFLIMNQGKPVSRDEIFSSVWKKEKSSANTVDVYIRHLRKKFETLFDFPIIKTVREKGYAVNQNVKWNF